MIALSEPILGEEEKRALCAVIDSRWLTMGERVRAFEKAFAEMHGTEDAVAVNSCTAALHLSLAALDIGPGDEVLVPSLTFVATANVVLYVGAKPIFVDIQALDSPHISLEDAAGKCTSRTKAIIVMHYGGYLADLPAWRSFCEKKRLMLIEDAAHSPAIAAVGRQSEAAAFSFFSNKNMSTAEGGMVISRSPSILQRVRHLRAHGMSSDTLTRHQGHAYSYDVTMLGYNYRMDELRASLGLTQLPHLSSWNQKRNKLSNCYREVIAARLPEVDVSFSQTHPTAAHLMPVILPASCNRQGVIDHMRKRGVQTSIHYPPVHLFSYYRKSIPESVLPITEEFCSRELTLPLHPGLTDDDVVFVVESLREVLNGPL